MVGLAEAKPHLQVPFWPLLLLTIIEQQIVKNMLLMMLAGHDFHAPGYAAAFEKCQHAASCAGTLARSATVAQWSHLEPCQVIKTSDTAYAVGV
jgi:hypothetical protein